MRICPADGKIVPLNKCNKVDLPAPRRPTNPSPAPAGDSSLSHAARTPLISRGQVFGALNVYGAGKGCFDAVRLQALESLANIAAAALLNADLYQKAGRRLDLVTTLRAIDMAITPSQDPRVTLDVLLDRVTSHLRVDAAAVLRLDEVTLELRHAASRGFRSRFIEQTRVPLGRGYAGRAASERCRVSCADLAAATDFLRGRLAAEEGFVAYDAVPMVSKNRVLGVLETFHRQPKGGRCGVARGAGGAGRPGGARAGAPGGG
jgi:GAF domain-containing protein